ncbi:MAG: FHA domain-containing protein [Kofleriaceae bacterium]|nr:FHA domain-containing protein [Kofleriaceae bacterium]
MTAHVVPRAKPILSAGDEGDEEEKTTIESPWEDEASTTVEQGEVADKIRALGGEPSRRQNTGVTNTSASQLDEPTVDDQNVPALAPVTQLRAESARLLITAGNDSGRQIEIRPGKTYTIGRAIDNDVVLTDIAVSRKHFDLRHEDGAWVIVDRGSGNGTVVNGNIEDNPFMLANGDTIEIGNTVFRYEHASGPARTRAPSNLGAFESEDEEMSTVAGKPMRPDIVDVEEMPPPRAIQPRPKTLPPPTPLRSARPPTQPPPIPSMLPAAHPLAGLHTSATMPLAPMANRPPTAPAAPAMLGDPVLANGMTNPLANGSSGMVPMSGMNPLAQGSLSGQPARPMFGQYPQATEIPPHSVHAQMLLIQTQNRRGDGSTAHVPPTPFDGVQMQPRYSQPQLSKRTKLILGGAGLALFAAIATIAIVKSGSSEKPKAVPAATTGAEGAQPKVEPSVTAIETPKPTAPTTTQPTTVAKTEPTATQPTTKTPTPQPVTTAKTEPKTEPKVEPKTVAKTEPKVEPKVVAKTEPKTVAKTEPRTVAKVEPKVEPKVEKKREPARTVTRTAAATDSSSARTKAESLYRAKKFGDASSVLAAAAKSAEDDEAKDLRRTADMYAKLGRSYSSGMAPAAKAVDAYEQLQSAINYDGNVGGAFTDELQTKLAQVAPKAAIGFMAAKNYPRARNAVITAEKLGSTAEALTMVRQKLESVASDLYNEAQKETDATAAKEKYRTIMSIVDSKSTWYGRAAKAIAKL